MTSLVNAQKLTDIIALSVNVISEVLADGKVDSSDIPSFLKLIGVFQTASGVNFTDFLSEVSKVKPTDINLLSLKLSDSLDISNEKAEDTIKFWINFTTKVYGILNDGYDLFKSFNS